MIYNNKINLDRFSTYNQLMEGNYAIQIHQPKSTIYWDWNAGVSVINKKGKLVNLVTWINTEGIANIIFILTLNDDGYHSTYDTKEEWSNYTPEG